MFLNISSSTGSGFAVLKRKKKNGRRLPVYDTPPGRGLRWQPLDQRIVLTMKLIVLNILGWSRCSYYNWASIPNQGPPSRENCSRRKLHASKEKGCQEKKTLTVRETILRTTRSSEKPLERSTSPGVFYCMLVYLIFNEYARKMPCQKMRG